MSGQVDLDQIEDKIEGRVARVPNLFLLDTSTSMKGSRIDQVNNGLEQFVREVAGDQEAEWAIDVSIVTFGGDISIEQPFEPVSDAWMGGDGNPNPPSLNASGTTPMCEAIYEGLEHLEDYKDWLDGNGYTRKRALVWLLTDGEPDNGPGTSEWNAAQDMIERGTGVPDDEDIHMFFFAAAVGDDAGKATLEELVSVGNQDVVAAFDLQEHMFEELFEVASKSAKGSATGDGGETTEEMLPEDIEESDGSSSGQV